MKINLGILGALCLTFTMSFSVSASQNLLTRVLPNESIINVTSSTLENDLLNPAPQTNSQADNDLLYLYNNNVIKNDYFNFNITVDKNWTKPSFEEVKAFANSQQQTMLVLAYGDHNTNPNALIFTGTMGNLPPESASFSLDAIVEMSKIGVKDLASKSGMTVTFSESKKTKLSGIDFRYLVCDMKIEGVVIKAYIYIGVKNNVIYNFNVTNVNNNNKSIAGKALKGIVIK